MQRSPAPTSASWSTPGGKPQQGMDRLDSRADAKSGRRPCGSPPPSTVRHLSTRAVGLDEATLQPARRWTADYVGGQPARRP